MVLMLRGCRLWELTPYLAGSHASQRDTYLRRGIRVNVITDQSLTPILTCGVAVTRIQPPSALPRFYAISLPPSLMIPGSLSFSMDSNDIILELEQLKGAFLKIADDDQKRMLDQQSTTLADVKDAMCKVMIALESRGGAGKTERIASRVTAVFERMTPVIDSLTNLHPVAPIVWGSIKVLLQVRIYSFNKAATIASHLP